MSGMLAIFIVWSMLAVVEAGVKPAPPIPVAPGDGWEVTDVALDFRWLHAEPFNSGKYISQEMEKLPTDRKPRYQIQIALDEKFGKIVLDDKCVFVIWKQDPSQRFIPEKLLKQGKYYWRVRALDDEGNQGEWTAVHHFRVGVSPEKPPALVREISSKNPLLMILTRFGKEPFDGDGTGNCINERVLPRDLRKYIAISGWGHVSRCPIEDVFPHYDMAEKMGIAVFIRGTFSLSEMDHAFKKYPKTIIGVEMDEMAGWWSCHPDNTQDRPDPYNYAPVHSLFLERAVRTATANGRYYLEAEGSYRALAEANFLNSSEWVKLMQENSANVIWGVKSNISPVLHASQAAARGMWLDGIVGNYNYWAEGFFWDHASFNDVGQSGSYREYFSVDKFPAVMFAQKMIVAAAQGATVFTVSGWHPAWDKTVDPPTPYYLEYTLPLFRKLIEENMIVTREEALANTKIAVDAEVIPTPPVLKTMGDKDYLRSGLAEPSTYMQYDALFRNVYNLSGPYYDFNSVIPDSGRYYFIPLVSPLVEHVFMTVPLSDVDTDDEVKKLIKPLYPQWYSGDAWICRIGDRFFVQNSRENDDVTQTYDIPLGIDFFKRIHGRVSLHSYVVGGLKDGGKTLWFQANTHSRTEYKGGGVVTVAPIRNTEIRIDAKRKPEVIVDPADALIDALWKTSDAEQAVGLPAHLRSNDELILTIGHRTGAVNITLKEE